MCNYEEEAPGLTIRSGFTDRYRGGCVLVFQVDGMTYEPDPDKLGLDVSFRVSAFALMAIGLVIALLSLVSNVYVGLLIMAAVCCLCLSLTRIQRLVMPYICEQFFRQTLEIQEDRLLCRGPSTAVTASIPIAAIDAERSRINAKRALILYRTPEGLPEAITIPLRLYDREVFEHLERVLSHGAAH